jgi:hypothetical protein
MLGLIGLMSMGLFGEGGAPTTSKPKEDSREDLAGLVAEYKLIQKKESKLSSNQRKYIVNRVAHHINRTGLISEERLNLEL